MDGYADLADRLARVKADAGLGSEEARTIAAKMAEVENRLDVVAGGLERAIVGTAVQTENDARSELKLLSWGSMALAALSVVLWRVPGLEDRPRHHPPGSRDRIDHVRDEQRRPDDRNAREATVG